MRIYGTSIFTDIKLSEVSSADGTALTVPNRVQILKTGNFNHPKFGNFEITTQTLSEMIANFKNRVRGIDLSFDYFHDSDKEASAWVGDLELSEDGTQLWATNVDWTPKARQKLAERELRYFSPDFAFQWTDPETGNIFKNVLFGGALTNRPFLKEMQAIVADELKGEKMTELEKALAKVKELEAANVKLSEDYGAAQAKLAAIPVAPAAPAAPKEDEGSEVSALQKTIADLQSQLAKAKSENDVMLAEKAKAADAAKVALAESEFTLMLSEGKACPAQKDAFLKGDMKEFVKLAQPMNMKATGRTEVVELAETDAQQIIKLAEEKQKGNPKLSRADALSIAKKELKK